MTPPRDVWLVLNQWTHRLVATVHTDANYLMARTGARLLLARGTCVQDALQQSIRLATVQIERKFHDLDVGEIALQIVKLLVECLAIMLATTGLGAAIGGVVGFFAGGIGAAPGAVEGAALGSEVGEWILAALGLAALAEFIVKGLPAIGRTYLTGLRQAWQAVTPAVLPQRQPHEDRFAVRNAAATLARGHVAMFVLLLMAVVAWLSKGRSMDDLAASASKGRLGPKFGKWLLKNEAKLKDDPRLRPPRKVRSIPGDAADAQADGPIRPRRASPAGEKPDSARSESAKTEEAAPKPVMPREKVPCFKTQKLPPGKYAELDRQLAGQQNALNKMTVQEYLDGRARYAAQKRKGAAQAALQARKKHQTKLVKNLAKTYRQNGLDKSTAESLAVRQVTAFMRTQDVLHAPDMIAGGKHDAIIGLGDRKVNQTIGRQWNRGRTQGMTRVEYMDAAAKAVPEEARTTTLMNVDLHRCK